MKSEKIRKSFSVAVYVVSIGAVFSLFYFNSQSSCREGSKEIEYARSLSNERLEKLYYDMKKYWLSKDVPIGGWYSFDEAMPEEFKDLKVGRIRPVRENIMLVGCFDEYAYLRFNGFDGAVQESIILSFPAPGEYNTSSEILWMK